LEDLFDLKRVDDSKPTEKMDILEERITKIIKMVKNLREEKGVLEARVSSLEDELRRKEEELERVKHQIEEAERVEERLNNLSEERGLIRTRIEDILRELESIELS